MKPTRLPELLAIAAAVAVVAYLGVRLMYASLPAIPLLAGVTLLGLAGIEAVLGHLLKARIEGKPGTRPVQPLSAARAVALAKASALAGAIMGGVWSGLLVYLLPKQAELKAAAADTPGAVVGLVSAIALVAAALWLQHCCRAPTGRNDRDQEHGDRR